MRLILKDATTTHITQRETCVRAASSRARRHAQWARVTVNAFTLAGRDGGVGYGYTTRANNNN